MCIFPRCSGRPKGRKDKTTRKQGSGRPIGAVGKKKREELERAELGRGEPLAPLVPLVPLVPAPAANGVYEEEPQPYEWSEWCFNSIVPAEHRQTMMNLRDAHSYGSTTHLPRIGLPHVQHPLLHGQHPHILLPPMPPMHPPPTPPREMRLSVRGCPW